MNNNNNVEFNSQDLSTRNEKRDFEINIGKLIPVLINKLWLIILVALVAAIGAYFYTSEMAVHLYKSTARVYIINRQNSLGTSMTDLSSAATIKEDFLVLIKSNEIYRNVLARIGEDPSNYKALSGQVSHDNNTDTRFVDITVTDPDPVRAKMLVDAFADVSRVKAREIMGVEDITIEEYGEIPTRPSSPNMSKNVVMAVAVAVILTVGVIVLINIFNDTIDTPSDIEKNLGLCVLGTVPNADLLRKLKTKAPVRKRPAPEQQPEQKA